MKTLKSLYDDIYCISELDAGKNFKLFETKDKINAIQIQSIGNLFSIVSSTKGQNVLTAALLAQAKSYNPDQVIKSKEDMPMKKDFLLSLKIFEIALTSLYKHKDTAQTKIQTLKYLKNVNTNLKEEDITPLFDNAETVFKADGKKIPKEKTK